MKIFTLLFFLISSIQILGQSIIKTHDFDSDDLSELHNFPNEPQNMLGVLMDITWAGIDYSFIKIDASSASPINFPSLTRITSLPLEFNNKFVFSAESSTYGQEIAIYDGLNTVIIDIEPGLNSSKPTFRIYNDQLFVVARIGNKRQLFELKPDNTLDQITNELNKDVYEFIIKKDDVIYYSQKNYDTQYSTYYFDSIITITKLDTYTDDRSEILTQTGTTITSAVFFNENLYFNLNFGFYEPSNFLHRNSIIKVYNDGSFLSLLEDSMNADVHHKLFVEDNKLYSMRKATEELFVSSDGLTFDTLYPLGLYEHFLDVIPGNGFHFLQSDNGSFHKLYRINNGVVSDAYSFKFHGHYLTSKEDRNYYVTVPVNSNMDESAYLIEFDELDNSVDSFYITNMIMHPPYFFGKHSGALWKDNSLNFIYGEDMGMDMMSQDIYRFDTDLGLMETKNEMILSVYPNPGEEWVTIETRDEGILNILSQEGKLVSEQNLLIGKNEVSLDNLAPGMYTMLFQGQTKKLIVR